MKTSYNYELIENYLDGILESKTAAEIKQLIDTDEDARAIAKGILILTEHFDGDEEVEQYLNKQLVNAHQQIEQHSLPKKSHSLQKIAASIILVAISGLVVYQMVKSDLSDLVSDQLEEPYKASVAVRGNENESAYAEALKAYDLGNYQQVVSQLQSENSAQANFLSGLSHLYQGRPDEAINFLGRSNLENSRYEEQGRWYLSLAYLKSGELDKGEKLLLRIKHAEGHFMKEEAVEILQFLND